MENYIELKGQEIISYQAKAQEERGEDVDLHNCTHHSGGNFSTA